MTDTEPHELKATELRLLGHFYQNDFRLVLHKGPASVDIGPPLSTWRSMAIMMALIGLIYAGFIWIAIASDAGEKFGPMIWVLLLMIGILAIAGPVVGHQLRLRYLRSRCPLVSYCFANSTVSILGGQSVFDRDEIYALIGLTLRDSHGESKSELQLMVHRDHSFVPHLITTDLSGSAQASYGQILREFRIATGVRTMIAEPEGLLNRGPIQLTELT
ncbi:hypothetical protein [Novipirellula sp.]|uniref:hypothetical protein n=1 Tax=Novipirellula sp. TaxID=2795430 RepID=UPI003564FF54